ncbi:MAG: hypothetical protein ACE5FI_11650 [Anaerolineales bacterium]
MKTTGVIVVFVVSLIVFCMLCALCLMSLVVYSVFSSPEVRSVVEATRAPTPVPMITLTPAPTPGQGEQRTLESLLAVNVPENDLREIAFRLKGLDDIPVVVSESPANYSPGEVVEFWASNTDTDENFRVAARLVYETDHVYFFAEEDLSVNEARVRELVDDFEQHSYPTNRAFFGEEWSPGVDGDVHLYILYARGLGFSVAGYYSSVDEYSHLVHEFSNEKEMFYINADATGPGDSSLPGTLAHEFQHMIHWYNDRNEETWLNEGSSVLSEFLNGHGADGFDATFTREPDIQLNAWTEGGPGYDSIPHYGAAFLFMTYFLDRFGETATQRLVAHPENGLVSVQAVLQELGVEMSAADLFADWVVANYLNDASIGDGRYGYSNYPQLPEVSRPTEQFRSCPVDPVQFTVHQFAADYVEFDCDGPYTVSFTGTRQIRVVPTDPHSGRYVFWGNRQDESDTTLTREFDLSEVDRATLTYWAWWAIEENFDYVYVEASTDGEHWTILETPGGTGLNPTGNNLGWGYHHNSGGGDSSQWVQETIDLSAYAGAPVYVRFEYITDAAVNRPGFLLDDLAVPEVDYFEDFEAQAHGWDAAGWVRFDNLLEQTWVVQVIEGDSVTRVPLTDGQGEVTLSGPATLVVSGTTPFTTEVASYELSTR